MGEQGGKGREKMKEICLEMIAHKALILGFNLTHCAQISYQGDEEKGESEMGLFTQVGRRSLGVLGFGADKTYISKFSERPCLQCVLPSLCHIESTSKHESSYCY